MSIFKNKKLVIASMLAGIVLAGCNKPDENDSSVTTNEPFADAGYLAGTYSQTGGNANYTVSVDLTATSATLTCSGGGVSPTGFGGPFTDFDSDGTYTVDSRDGVVHSLACMQINPGSATGLVVVDSASTTSSGSLNFGATTGITFCCGEEDGSPLFYTPDFN